MRPEDKPLSASPASVVQLYHSAPTWCCHQRAVITTFITIISSSYSSSSHHHLYQPNIQPAVAMSYMHYNIFELIEERGIRKHKGGCQCGEVRFEVFAPSQVTVVECSCESCQKRQTRFFEVSSDHFRLVQGHAVLSTFGSYQIKHSFCTKCGVQCFCVPSADNSTNDTIGVMPHCLDAGTMRKIKIQKGVGKHTDSAMKCLQPSTDRQR